MVAGSVALLHLAQTRLSSSGPILTRYARGAYAAFMLQVPVLIGLSVALRPLAVPALAKGVTIGILGVGVDSDRYRSPARAEQALKRLSGPDAASSGRFPHRATRRWPPELGARMGMSGDHSEPARQNRGVVGGGP